MPFTRKKMYRVHVREQILAGLLNNAAGAWVSENASGASNGVIKQQREGCAGAEPGVGRPRKGGQVRWSKNSMGRGENWPVLPKHLRSEIITKKGG